MIEKGIIFLNNNRKDAGLLFNMSIADNMAIPVIDPAHKGRAALPQGDGGLHALLRASVFHCAELNLTISQAAFPAGTSKRSCSRSALGTKPKFLIVNEPTRGIDVGAKLEILRLLNEIVNSGVSVLCFSSDLPELITLSDRIAVMNGGRIAGVIDCGRHQRKQRHAAGRRGRCEKRSVNGNGSDTYKSTGAQKVPHWASTRSSF